jgi:uncharacterized protein YprB with RNaseH-like and TPR domain
MLRNTFCHIPGVGLKSERELWSGGILSWDDLLNSTSVDLRRGYRDFLRSRVKESTRCLNERDADYFAENLPGQQHWRLFPEFRDSTAYLDIETTGVAGPSNHITTIALYDGKTIFYYVHGHNLDDFKKDIMNYRVVVTYNGKCFDVPVINRSFGIRLNQAHIDLRFLLHSLGYKGGLKGCERRFGISREELEGVDGYFAVLLWHDFKENRNLGALETLLAYNILDAVNLETLMVCAYNLKIKDTPFGETHQLPMPTVPRNPFDPDVKTMRRIADQYYVNE